MLDTLLQTAKLNELNPESYLRLVLQRIAEQPSDRLDDLLPWNDVRELARADRLAA